MLTANAEEAAEAAQTLPRIGSRLHRSRRGKQASKNAIGFSLSLQEAIQTSDSESDLEEEETPRLGAFNSRYYRMPEKLGDGRQLSDDIDEMQGELDRLVRFIHRDVERLAGSAAGATSAFSVLAFALEDWKR
jgi:gamma-tubulin complex component 5